MRQARRSTDGKDLEAGIEGKMRSIAQSPELGEENAELQQSSPSADNAPVSMDTDRRLG